MRKEITSTFYKIFYLILLKLFREWKPENAYGVVYNLSKTFMENKKGCVDV